MRTLRLTAVTLALLGVLAAGCEQSGPGQTGSPGRDTTSAPRDGGAPGTAATPDGGVGQTPGAQPGQSPQ